MCQRVGGKHRVSEVFCHTAPRFRRLRCRLRHDAVFWHWTPIPQSGYNAVRTGLRRGTGAGFPQAFQPGQQGSVAEWFKALVLKTSVGGSLPWVRIPPLPPNTIAGWTHRACVRNYRVSSVGCVRDLIRWTAACSWFAVPSQVRRCGPETRCGLQFWSGHAEGPEPWLAVADHAARLPARLAAISVVPEPPEISGTLSPRWLQSRMPSQTRATGSAVGCIARSPSRATQSY